MSAPLSQCAQEEVRSVVRFLHVYENKSWVEIHRTVKRAYGDKIMDISSTCKIFPSEPGHSLQHAKFFLQNLGTHLDMQNFSFRT